MSDITVTVDLKEAIGNLTEPEKKNLVKYLRTEMEEKFEAALTDEDSGHYFCLEADVDVELDDVVGECSSYERGKLYRKLKEEFGDDGEDDTLTLISRTRHYSENEFSETLTKLWENRWLLNNDQKSRIMAISQENFS